FLLDLGGTKTAGGKGTSKQGGTESPGGKEPRPTELAAPLFTLPQPKSVNDLMFSPDGKWLVITAWGGLTIWDAASGQKEADVPTERDGEYLFLLGWTPDSKSLLVMSTLGRKQATITLPGGKLDYQEGDGKLNPRFAATTAQKQLVAGFADVGSD